MAKGNWHKKHSKPFHIRESVSFKLFVVSKPLTELLRRKPSCLQQRGLYGASRGAQRLPEWAGGEQHSSAELVMQAACAQEAVFCPYAPRLEAHGSPLTAQFGPSVPRCCARLQQDRHTPAVWTCERLLTTAVFRSRAMGVRQSVTGAACMPA